jgi:transposase-like protein
MKLKNEFTSLQKAIWAFDYTCHAPKKIGLGKNTIPFCNSNVGVSIHHIFGRISSSTLNSIPLCDECHRNYTMLDKSQLLKTTIKFLCDPNNQYQFNQNDIKFYEENKRYYK